MKHPGCEWGFGLLHQGVHRDWSSALYCFLNMAELSLDVPEPLLLRPLLCLLMIKDESIALVIPIMPLLIVILSRRFIGVVLPGVASFSFSICFPSRCCYSSRVMRFWPPRAYRTSWGRCSFLVSCSNTLSKRWLVRRSASISSVLACRVSSVPLGGRLSTSPCWSCILRGLAWLLLVFLVYTISH